MSSETPEKLIEELRPVRENKRPLPKDGPDIWEVCTLLFDSLEQVLQERDRLKEALKAIAAPQFGVQSIYEETEPQTFEQEEQLHHYYAGQVSQLTNAARQALSKTGGGDDA